MTLLEPARWHLFGGLDRLADLRDPRGETLKIWHPQQGAPEGPYIWVYCSTIGEVNACKAFLQQAAEQGPLVLLTDRHCYRDSYWRHFPNAVVVELSGSPADGARLARELPPQHFIVCEIPAQPVEAPCRLSYGVLRAAKQAGAQCSLINAWLYGYQASCRIDAVEQRLLGQAFIQSFDVISTQTESVRKRLIELGADPACVQVFGNLKFDALEDTSTHLLDQRSRQVIEQLEFAGREMVVAGCLTGDWEFELVLEAFAKAYAENPSLYLILAPRHPEYEEPMRHLWRLLDNSGLSYCVKSRLDKDESAEPHALMLLDTFGELKSFYSRCSVGYVGINHNVLEPLSFGRTVLVSPGWEATYPSYPVYLTTRDLELIVEVADAKALTREMLKSNQHRHADEIKQLLAEQCGAAAKNMRAVFGRE
ncbi:3-deoxy-D-manno-octulosonic acid transferase [Motiliproteus sp.]|uniref:3-deoxy-D-manno-octulosonic acid transferase n=1 Tax=Motiliproteus sp. TaxID=1898955 RepID=UPI003BAB621A